MPRIIDKSPIPRRQGVLNRGPFSNQQSMALAPSGLTNPQQQGLPSASQVVQFEQDHLSGAPLGNQAATQFDQYRQGNTPAYALTSPAARRAAYQHFEQHGNPATAAQSTAINQDVQRRLQTPDPVTGLTPQQTLDAGAGAGVHRTQAERDALANQSRSAQGAGASADQWQQARDFQQRYLHGTSDIGGAFDEYQQYLAGQIAPYDVQSPAARRAAYDHYAQHGNPAVAARQQAINQDVQRRLATPDPQTGLTPQQALEAGSGQGRPFTAQQMATKQALREQHAARTRETQAKLAERKQKQAQARAERRGGNLLAPHEFELRQQMEQHRQQMEQHRQQNEPAGDTMPGKMAVVNLYREQGKLEGVSDEVVTALAKHAETPNQLSLILDRADRMRQSASTSGIKYSDAEHGYGALLDVASPEATYRMFEPLIEGRVHDRTGKPIVPSAAEQKEAARAFAYLKKKVADPATGYGQLERWSVALDRLPERFREPVTRRMREIEDRAYDHARDIMAQLDNLPPEQQEAEANRLTLEAAARLGLNPDEFVRAVSEARRRKVGRPG